MDHLIHHDARLIQEVASLPLLDRYPLTMIDVGCSGGLHPVIERFGPGICAHGFDPVLDEVNRLNSAEVRPNVRYYGAFVGAAHDHPFHSQPATPVPPRFVAWDETSAAWALELTPPSGVRENRTPPGLTANIDRKIVLDVHLDQEAIDFVDFLKVDVDGADLEVLYGAERTLAAQGVGAVAIEVAFFGSAHSGANTFHNIDRVLRGFGMELMNLSIWRYSMRSLPSMFKFRGVGETAYGPPFLGDAVYVNPSATAEGGPLAQNSKRRAAAVLKQAALMDLFGVPDCAARILLRDREVLAPFADVTKCLDALVRPLHGTQLSYQQVTERFQQDMSEFFPRSDA